MEPHSTPTSPASASVPAETPPASRGQRILTRLLWVGLVLAMATVIVAKITTPNRDVPMLFPAATFSLTDQNGKSFSDVNLRGKSYICDFIFTSCGSACPLMTRHMADLQKRLPTDIELVSFSVNPEYDTPPVLKQYAKEYGADESRWHFLTGTPRQMSDVAQGMRVTATPKSENAPILHSEFFLLVDRDNNVRGVYDSNDPQKIQDLIDDAKFTARKRWGRW